MEEGKCLQNRGKSTRKLRAFFLCRCLYLIYYNVTIGVHWRFQTLDFICPCLVSLRGLGEIRVAESIDNDKDS